MIDRDSTERLRAAFGAPSHLAADGERCPGADRLWDAANGQLDRAGVGDVLLHCGECGVCAEAWRLARIDLPRPASDLRAAPVRWRPVAVAAAAIAIVGLLAVVIPKRIPEPSPVLRQAGPRALESTSDDRLPRDRCLLSWTSVSDESRYDLRVMTEELDTLHVAWNLEESRLLIPSAALESLPAGSRILWQVTIRSPEGDADVSDTFATVVE